MKRKKEKDNHKKKKKQNILHINQIVIGIALWSRFVSKVYIAFKKKKITKDMEKKKKPTTFTVYYL